MAIQLKTITAPLDTGVDQEYFIPDTASELQNDSYVPGANIKEALETINDATLAKFEQVEAEPGSVVTFEDGADNLPLKKLKINIEPVQEGTGDPSPDNIRPISGWTGVKVNVAGSNIFDEVWESGSINGVDGTNVVNAGWSRSTNLIPVPSGGRLFLNFEGLSSTTYAFIFYYYRDGKYKASSNQRFDNSTIINIPDNCGYIRFQYKRPIAEMTNYDCCVSVIGMLSDKPYTVTTYSISFPSEAGTVYSGTLEVNDDGTGALEVNWRKIIADGKNFIVRTVGSTTTVDGETLYFCRCLINANTGETGINNTTDNVTIISDKLKTTTINEFDSIIITSNGTAIHLRLPDHTISTPAEANAYLVQNPIEIAYKLATPWIFSLTVPQVKTLLGLNNIWADTGDITQLIYRTSSADSAAADMIATVEGSTTAEQSYDIGDLLIVKSTLYKVTSPIAAGETINPGANCEATTVEAELKGQRSTRVPITLTASGWTNATQTATVAGVSSDVNAQVIEPIPADNSKSEYCSKGVWCESQDANSLTFKYWKAPDNDLDVNIIITEVQSNG